MNRQLLSYLSFVWLMSLLRLWSKLWLWGAFRGLSGVFRLRDLFRAVAKRDERIPHTHGWLQTGPEEAFPLL